MAQISLHWDGATTGDADLLTENAADGIGYRLANENYESPFIDRMMRAVLNGTGNRGVLRSWLNDLAVTGVATPVSVDTGAAIIYGLYYENDALLNIAVGTPTNDVRYDLVVVRRNWTAQTARITLVSGTEGGAVPALTQSPAPVGTGIYDIPLAVLETDVLGNITVTDAREYVTFSTAAVADSIETATIANETVDLANRAQTTKSIRFGGGDLLPLFSRFNYNASSYLDGDVVATWGAVAATMDGWQVGGSVDPYAFYVVFNIPADYVPGTNIGAALWFIDDWAGDTNIDVYSMWQIYADDTSVQYIGTYTNTDVIITSVLDTVHFAVLAPISGSFIGGEMVMYCIRCSGALAEALLFNGIEFTYTGYT